MKSDGKILILMEGCPGYVVSNISYGASVLMFAYELRVKRD